MASSSGRVAPARSSCRYWSIWACIVAQVLALLLRLWLSAIRDCWIVIFQFWKSFPFQFQLSVFKPFIFQFQFPLTNISLDETMKVRQRRDRDWALNGKTDRSTLYTVTTTGYTNYKPFTTRCYPATPRCTKPSNLHAAEYQRGKNTN